MKRNQVIILVVGLLLSHQMAFAISENLLNSKTSLALGHWFESHFTKGSFKTKEGVKLVYKKLMISNPKGALFFIHGKSEFSYKYAELFFDISVMMCLAGVSFISDINLFLLLALSIVLSDLLLT